MKLSCGKLFRSSMLSQNLLRLGVSRSCTLIILDDVADSPQIVRGSHTLHSLFTRGRHAGISTICSLQSYRAIHPIIRKNATALVVFRLRSVAEKQAIVEENSAVYSKDVVEEMYETATERPHSFLYLNLLAKRREDLFWEGFTQRLLPEDVTTSTPPSR